MPKDLDWIAYKIEDLQELLKLIGEVHQSPEMYSEGHMTELATDLKETSGQLIAALEEQSVSAVPESFLDDVMEEIVGPLGPRRSKKVAKEIDFIKAQRGLAACVAVLEDARRDYGGDITVDRDCERMLNAAISLGEDIRELAADLGYSI